MVFNGKKGDIAGIFLFICISLLLTVVVGLMAYVGDTFYSDMMSNVDSIQGSFTSYNATELVQDNIGDVVRAYGIMRWAGPMIIVAMILSIFISNYYVQTRPVVIVVHILLSIVAGIISVPISNAYEQIMNTPLLASTFATYPGQNWIMLNLPVWVVITGLVGIGILFLNWSRSREGPGI